MNSAILRPSPAATIPEVNTPVRSPSSSSLNAAARCSQVSFSIFMVVSSLDDLAIGGRINQRLVYRLIRIGTALHQLSLRRDRNVPFAKMCRTESVMAGTDPGW